MKIKKIEKIGNRLEDDCYKFFSNLCPEDRKGNLEILNIRLKYRPGFIKWKEAKIQIKNTFKGEKK